MPGRTVNNEVGKLNQQELADYDQGYKDYDPKTSLPWWASSAYKRGWLAAKSGQAVVL